MRKGAMLQLSLLAALAIVMAGCGSTQSSPPASDSGCRLPRRRVRLRWEESRRRPCTRSTAKLSRSIRASKQVTLEGPKGKDITLTVHDSANLQSLKAGDRYVAQFTESIVIVAKGPSDKTPVATLAGGLWVSNPGQTPGAVAARQAHLVVVVSAIDQADQRVTLLAPDGSTENIHVTNADALQRRAHRRSNRDHSHAIGSDRAGTGSEQRAMICRVED